MKQCSKCLENKPLTDFYEHKGARTSPGYRNPSCKTCLAKQSKAWAKNNPDKVKKIRQRSKLKEKYDVSIEEYELLYKEQAGHCYLCLQIPKRNRALNVDHCHTTGRVRKLLCDKCNMALGLINDDKELLLKMVNYLNENSSV